MRGGSQGVAGTTAALCGVLAVRATPGECTCSEMLRARGCA